MRIAPGQADRKVRGHAIVDAEGQTSGGEIIPRRYARVIDTCELTKPRHEHAPAVLRRGLHHRRAALAFWPGRSREARTEVRRAAVNRETSRAEASAARADVVHPPLQIHGLNICKGDTDIENRGQL